MSLDLYNWQSGQVLCYVAKPDSESVVLEVEVDRNSTAQDVLDKVCSLIGTVESDYFGLQYITAKRELFWLNLRNKLVGQLPGQPPYRLRLRVKYFVQPHLLLQGATRELFFTQLKADIFSGRISVPEEYLSILGALLAEVEFGDYDSRNFASMYSTMKFGEKVLSNADILSIGFEHKKLTGLSRPQVVCLFLKEISKLPSYGTEIYQAKLECRETNELNSIQTSNCVDVNIRLGPLGLEIVEAKTDEIKRIPFTAVQLATHTGKNIDVSVLQDDGSVIPTTFRMASEKGSNAFYRALTEMLAFFTWETVHSSVIHQYSRDFKGHLMALFRPDDTDMGKQYVFDVQKTWREVHDSVRRKLYKLSKQCETTSPCTNDENIIETTSNTCQDNHNDEMQYLRERICAIKDALTCRICLDKEINTVFWPCGHQVCCFKCADVCQICPICRRDIEKSQIVYTAISRDFVEGKQDTRKSSQPQNVLKENNFLNNITCPSD